MTGRQSILPVRRAYNRWVADETLEDFALRFTAEGARPGRANSCSACPRTTPAPARNCSNPAFPLTEREAEVLLWLARGKSNRDIAAILELAPPTVNEHLETVFAKLGVENRASAAVLAVRAR